MNKLTERMVRLAMAEDAEITSEQARYVVDYLKGRSRPSGTTEAKESQILVGTSEAARLLSVSRQTLWRLEKQGVVNSVILGSRGGCRIKRYSLAALKQLAAESHT